MNMTTREYVIVYACMQTVTDIACDALSVPRCVVIIRDDTVTGLWLDGSEKICPLPWLADEFDLTSAVMEAVGRAKAKGYGDPNDMWKVPGPDLGLLKRITATIPEQYSEIFK